MCSCPPAGVPPAVKSLFYGGEHNGYEFVYPKGGPVLIAELSSPPAPTYSPVAVVTETSTTKAEPTLAPEPAPEAAPPAVVREPAKVLPPPAVVHPSPTPAPSGGARVSADSAKRDRATLTKADITKSAVAVFGDSVAAGAPAFLPTWDIDVRSYEAQTRVQHYVAMYTGPSRDRIMERLQVGARYEPMIRAKFREGGLPEDLYYLVHGTPLEEVRPKSDISSLAVVTPSRSAQ